MSSSNAPNNGWSQQKDERNFINQKIMHLNGIEVDSIHLVMMSMQMRYNEYECGWKRIRGDIKEAMNINRIVIVRPIHTHKNAHARPPARTHTRIYNRLLSNAILNLNVYLIQTSLPTLLKHCVYANDLHHLLRMITYVVHVVLYTHKHKQKWMSIII